MRFERLNKWSSLVLDTDPDITTVNFDIKTMLQIDRQFECKDPVTECYKMDEDFELANAQMCLMIYFLFF